MATNLNNLEPRHQSEIDLSGTDSIRSQPFFTTQDPQRGLMKERGAKAIAIILVSSFVAIILVSIISSSLLTAFVSLAAAQGFITTVITLLEAATKFVNVIIWPLLAYYFFKEQKGKN